MLDEDFLTCKAGRNSNDASDFYDGIIEDIKFYKNYIPDLPPLPPDITGPTQGTPGQTLSFTFNAVDPEGQNVKFNILWGDGESETTGEVPSGSNEVVTHVYDVQGDYTITATAEDINGKESDPGTHSISIPRNKVQTNPLIQFLQSHPNMFPLLRYILGL
jgi:hypothetical protein